MVHFSATSRPSLASLRPPHFLFSAAWTFFPPFPGPLPSQTCPNISDGEEKQPVFSGLTCGDNSINMLFYDY
jgi:hypothetical protein